MTVRRASKATAVGQGVEAVDGLDDLADALLSLRTKDECRRFLRDLCTLAELQALAHRWRIVMLLDQELPYLEVAQRVPASTATVTRVAHWLHHGTGGYTTALERIRRAKGSKGVR
jgi:TrpR-related protein YerC/YecD